MRTPARQRFEYLPFMIPLCVGRELFDRNLFVWRPPPKQFHFFRFNSVNTKNDETKHKCMCARAIIHVEESEINKLFRFSISIFFFCSLSRCFRFCIGQAVRLGIGRNFFRTNTDSSTKCNSIHLMLFRNRRKRLNLSAKSTGPVYHIIRKLEM